MRQLIQNLKNGKMEILEVPFPLLEKGWVLVKNHFSLISPGTEGKTVKDARRGYLSKAKARQEEVKKVIDMARTVGIKETYDLVRNKLEAPSALGYSSAGEVIKVSDGVKGFKIGDHVACGGGTAVHAEIIAVPKNLCARVPKRVSLREAAFTTLAAVVIQGIRQADLRFGENCVVIGLGLLGRLSIQILSTAGIKALGIDIDQTQVEEAISQGVGPVVNRNQPGIEEYILDFTQGNGADAVIITAATSSLDPVEFAGKIARKKGRVVVVGSVPTGFSRTNYYRKELELRMSSSYGPGRYDPEYEEKGIDYPIGYVRWTENRNMQAFIEMLAEKKLNVERLISHVFKLENACDAYDMIVNKSEPYTGILIDYSSTRGIERKIVLKEQQFIPGKVYAGFIGAGTFAQNVLLPKIHGLCDLVGVMTARGNETRYVADKYGFNYGTDNVDDILNDNNINTIFILTRHNLHADYIIQALKKGKNVYTEKPLCMTEIELESIKREFEGKNLHLMVGFNRRFSPFITRVKQLFIDDMPKSLNFRINAGRVSSSHWVNDPAIGGGRIIGEVCHFIDLAAYLAGGKIISVSADALKSSDNIEDTVAINLAFENGSMASISYFSNGSKKLSKEQLEIFCGGDVAVIDDFRKMSIFSHKITSAKLKHQDKGHREQLKKFIESIEDGTPTPIAFDEIYQTTLVTFKVIEALQENKKIQI